MNTAVVMYVLTVQPWVASGIGQSDKWLNQSDNPVTILHLDDFAGKSEKPESIETSGFFVSLVAGEGLEPSTSGMNQVIFAEVQYFQCVQRIPWNFRLLESFTNFCNLWTVVLFFVLMSNQSDNSGDKSEVSESGDCLEPLTI